MPKYLVALEPLFIGTARAHNPGDVVHADAVKANGWSEQTTGLNTKAGKAARGLGDDAPDEPDGDDGSDAQP